MAVIIFDSQFDEPNGILRNKFGLRDARELERRIASLSALRVLELSRTPLTGKFDVQHLRRIHQYIFQDVFPWAGESAKSPPPAQIPSDFRRRSF